MAHGQTPTLAYVGGEWIPDSQVRAPVGLDGRVDPTLELEVGAFAAGISVPIVLGDQAVLLPGVSYDFLGLNQAPVRFGLPERLELHVVTASVLMEYRFDPKWSAAGQLAASLAGDFSEVREDHLRLSGFALLSYDFSERFSLGLGLLVTWRFGTALPVPAIRVNWTISETLVLDGVLPAQLRFAWQPHDRFEIGITGSIRGQSLALSSGAVQERWPCSAQPVNDPATVGVDETVASPDRCFSNLAYSRGDIGPAVAFRVAKSLWLSAHASVALYRRYEFLNDMGETPEVGDLTVDPNVTLRLLLTFRIPRPSKDSGRAEAGGVRASSSSRDGVPL